MQHLAAEEVILAGERTFTLRADPSWAVGPQDGVITQSPRQQPHNNGPHAPEDTTMNATQTPKTHRLSRAGRARAYLVAAVVVVLACLASWAATGSPAGMTSLPIAVVFLGLAAHERNEGRKVSAHA